MITNNFMFRIGKKDADIKEILEEIQKRESASAWTKRAIREKAEREKIEKK